MRQFESIAAGVNATPPGSVFCVRYDVRLVIDVDSDTQTGEVASLGNRGVVNPDHRPGVPNLLPPVGEGGKIIPKMLDSEDLGSLGIEPSAGSGLVLLDGHMLVGYGVDRSKRAFVDRLANLAGDPMPVVDVHGTPDIDRLKRLKALKEERMAAPVLEADRMNEADARRPAV